MIGFCVGMVWLINSSFVYNINNYNIKTCSKFDLVLAIIYCFIIDLLLRGVLVLLFYYQLCQLKESMKLMSTSPTPTTTTTITIENIDDTYTDDYDDIHFPDHDIDDDGHALDIPKLKPTQLSATLTQKHRNRESQLTVKKYLILLIISMIFTLISFILANEIYFIVAISIDLIANNICLLNWFKFFEKYFYIFCKPCVLCCNMRY